MPTLGEHETFPVTLDLTGPKGRQLGRERGWIAFVYGWLVYEGLRTSFSVDALSLEGAKRTGRTVRLDLPGGGRARLDLLADALQTDRPSKWGDRKRLANVFEAWLVQSPVTGEPIMPPDTLHPSLLVEGLQTWVVGIAISLVPALIGLVAGAVAPLVAGLVATAITVFGYRWESRRVAPKLAALRP